ncbi:hypothetical protein A2U01_0080948, partial [Trifolium medium]|nr:hypothetical protein [Trifolium medium]
LHGVGRLQRASRRSLRRLWCEWSFCQRAIRKEILFATADSGAGAATTAELILGLDYFILIAV